MKKTLLVLLILTPISLFAQASGYGDTPGIFSFLIGLAICILVFLALREVMAWYWKINAIIANQDKIIRLLEDQQAYNKERAKVEDKHNNYMENNLFSIKDHLTKQV